MCVAPVDEDSCPSKGREVFMLGAVIYFVFDFHVKSLPRNSQKKLAQETSRNYKSPSNLALCFLFNTNNNNQRDLQERRTKTSDEKTKTHSFSGYLKDLRFSSKLPSHYEIPFRVPPSAQEWRNCTVAKHS